MHWQWTGNAEKRRKKKIRIIKSGNCQRRKTNGFIWSGIKGLPAIKKNDYPLKYAWLRGQQDCCTCRCCMYSGPKMSPLFSHQDDFNYLRKWLSLRIKKGPHDSQIETEMQPVNILHPFPKLCSQNNTSCDVNKSTSVAAAGSKNHNYGIISLEKFKELTVAHFELPHLSHVSSGPQLIRQSPMLHPSSN